MGRVFERMASLKGVWEGWLVCCVQYDMGAIMMKTRLDAIGDGRIFA